jgi:hypothetical protein
MEVVGEARGKVEVMKRRIDLQDQNEQEWISEVERRARAAKAGDPGLSWEEVRSSIERRLAGDRTGTPSA